MFHTTSVPLEGNTAHLLLERSEVQETTTLLVCYVTCTIPKADALASRIFETPSEETTRSYLLI